MGHQIQFYATQNDLVLLNTALQDKGICIFENQLKTQNLVDRKNIVVAPFQQWCRCYMSKAGMEESLILREVPAQHYWHIDLLRSPAIQFSGCHFDGLILKRGRLFYDVGFYNEEEIWVKKPTEFLRWAESVFRTVKKIWPYNSRTESYMGSDALAQAMQDKIKLVAYAVKSQPK